MTEKSKILTIASMGNPKLYEVSQPVQNLFDPEIQNLIKSMKQTVDQLNCSGLAAPQVFVPLRIVMFRVMTETTNPGYVLTPEFDPDGVPWTTMINPIITPLTDQMDTQWESCLSLPGLMGKVPRYFSIEYTFLTPEGKKITRTAHGFHARVVQHECDHLDGILYPQRIKDLRDFGFKEEIVKTLL